MKKLLSVSLALMLVLSVLCGVTVWADDNFQGAGTADNPFLISTAADLTKLSELTNAAATNEAYGAAHYKLTADIDMTGATFLGLNCMDPVYNYKYFTGVFDGNGHVIKNITINSTSSRARGFISMASGATVKNLGIENISIKGGAMGGIIGQDNGSSTVENCYVNGMTATKVVNYQSVAGIIGYATASSATNVSTITNCYAVNLPSNAVRAIIGYDPDNSYKSQGKLENCYANLSDNVVGLGGNDVTNCYASVAASGVSVENLGDAFCMAAGSDFPALKVFAYHVTVSENENADVSLSSEYVLRGNSITATVKAKIGYKVTKVTVNGDEYALNDAGEVSFVPASNSEIVVETEEVLPALGSVSTHEQDKFVYEAQTYSGRTFITYVTVANYKSGLACGVKVTDPKTGNAITLPASNVTNDGSFAIRVFGDEIEDNEELNTEHFEGYIG